MTDQQTSGLDQLELAAWRAFVRAALLVTNLIDAELQAAFDVTHTDFAAMVMLREAPHRRLRMAEVADGLGVDRSALTYRVKRLEARGLVLRDTHVPGDGRGTYAVLTDAGVSFLRRCSRSHVADVRRHFVDHLDRGDLPGIAVTMAKLAQPGG